MKSDRASKLCYISHNDKLLERSEGFDYLSGINQVDNQFSNISESSTSREPIILSDCEGGFGDNQDDIPIGFINYCVSLANSENVRSGDEDRFGSIEYMGLAEDNDHISISSAEYFQYSDDDKFSM